MRALVTLRRSDGTWTLAKDARLMALWNGRLGHQMEALPQYDEVFRAVRRELRQAGFPK